MNPGPASPPVRDWRARDGAWLLSGRVATGAASAASGAGAWSPSRTTSVAEALALSG